MANISIGSGVFDVIFGLLSRGLKLKREEKIRREWRKLDGKITDRGYERPVDRRSERTSRPLHLPRGKPSTR